MLTSAPTPHGAGITLYGDPFDLEALHATIHKIITETSMAEPARDFVLGLAYDIRKANESQREKRTFRLEEGKVSYRGVSILWPYFIPQLAMLRHYAGYRPTDHRDQGCLYLLEDCAVTSLLAFNPMVGKECAEILLNFPSFAHDYLFAFCSVCARKYVARSSARNRFKSLPKTLRAIFWMSPEYGAFAEKMQASAKQHNCTPQELRDVTAWPKFQW